MKARHLPIIFFLGIGSLLELSCNSSDYANVNIADSSAAVTTLETSSVSWANTPWAQPDCVTSQPGDAAFASVANKKTKLLWKAFRERFPYHIQIIGASEIEADGSVVMLISEPPPFAKFDEINAFFNCFSHNATIETHLIGYDGWVKDVVVSLTNIDNTKLDSLKSKLTQYLFGTDYGRYCLKLQFSYGQQYNATLKEQVNYQIAPNELQEWFCGANAIEFDKGTIPQLLSNYSNTGIFYSKERGFVVWVIDTDSYIDNEVATIRKFSLDADLIIGAVQQNNKLAIIGRERQTSVFELPPLRTETVLQLASANDRELAQSYERLNIGACKLSDGRDWAPIYLSDELLNTEYGSLLNITDQLLKSWSQNGQVTYANFNYQRPSHWAFNKALVTMINDELGGSRPVTFNWNTAGAVFQYQSQPYSILGMNRVGSLPVAYIPDEQSSAANDNYKSVEPYEIKGYDFFSNMNDANLIRAAQYAALYQIFKEYKIKSSAFSITSSFNTFKPLEKVAEQFFERVQSLNDDQIHKLAVNIWTSIVKDRSIIPDVLIDDLESDILELRESLNELDTRIMREKIIQRIVNRNDDGIGFLDEDDINLSRNISSLVFKTRKVKWNFRLIGINPDSVVKAYADYNKQSSPVWIKTPSVVISWGENKWQNYGGHNIDAALLKVEKDASVPKGTIRFDDGRIRINPADENGLNPSTLRKMGVEVRNAERYGISSIEEFHFAGGPPKPPRDYRTVFSAPPPPPNSPRGFIENVHGVLEKINNTYRVGGTVVQSCEELQSKIIEYARQNKKIAIEFRGFTDDAVEMRLYSAELEMKTGGKFRKLQPDEVMSMRLENPAGHVNSQFYVFEGEPVPLGAQSMQATLTAKNGSGAVFIEAKAKSLGVFSRMKAAFLKAFNFSKENKVDFIRQTFKEMNDAGLGKKDFAVVLKSSADCVICKKDQLIIDGYIFNFQNLTWVVS